MTYSISTTLIGDIQTVIAQTKQALSEEGFGVLTEIDVAATLKKKLDVEHPPYVILGACNPPFAHEALIAEPEIGLLLPCNVIVYESDGRVIVSAIKPSVGMSMVENHSLAAIAGMVEEKLQRVVDSIQ